MYLLLQYVENFAHFRIRTSMTATMTVARCNVKSHRARQVKTVSIIKQLQNFADCRSLMKQGAGPEFSYLLVGGGGGGGSTTKKWRN